MKKKKTTGGLAQEYIIDAACLPACLPARQKETKQTVSSKHHAHLHIRPRVEDDYPLNLSILISGGKETNRDSLSKGD